MTQVTRAIVLAVVASAAAPIDVWGQESSASVEQLRQALKPGRKIVVTDATGQREVGVVGQVSADEFSVRALRSVQAGSGGELLEHKYSLRPGPMTMSVKEDSIWDGALIGGGILGGVTALALYGPGASERYGSCSQAQPESFCASTTVLFTAIGLAGGALLDLAKDHTEINVVYGRGSEARTSLRIAPWVGKNGTGGVVVLGF